MRYLAVLLVSLAVGAVVYVVSLRGEEPVAVGFEPSEPTPEPPATGTEPPRPRPGYTYLQVPVVGRPSPAERLQGLLGSLALVVMGAAALAFALWALGALIARTIRSYLGS